MHMSESCSGIGFKTASVIIKELHFALMIAKSLRLTSHLIMMLNANPLNKYAGTQRAAAQLKLHDNQTDGHTTHLTFY